MESTLGIFIKLCWTKQDYSVCKSIKAFMASSECELNF